MAGADEGAIGQGKDLLMHALMKCVGVPLLEIRPATAPDEKRVSGEGEDARLESQHVGHAAVRVSGGGPNLKAKVAKVHIAAMQHMDISLSTGCL
mmetsp:Transcript_19413/g.36484  ORF Transcript_19413/g.36484 Transcript_19413/m.36484 type:complete len:95 (-) Transcript_19413:710-994(-)